jgi:hypothetical protein
MANRRYLKNKFSETSVGNDNKPIDALPELKVKRVTAWPARNLLWVALVYLECRNHFLWET